VVEWAGRAINRRPDLANVWLRRRSPIPDDAAFPLVRLVSAAVAVTVILVMDCVTSAARAAPTQRITAPERGDLALLARAGLIAARRNRSPPATRLSAPQPKPGDRGRLRAACERGVALAAAQADFLDVVAADGTIVSSAHWPARFGYRHPWAGVSGGEAPAQAHFATGGTPARNAGPGRRPKCCAGDRGSIWRGRRLDEKPGRWCLRECARLHRNVEPELAPAVIDASGQVPQGAQLDQLIARVRQTGQEATEAIDWPDGPETVTAIPLAARSGPVLGVLLVGSSGRELATLVDRIRWSGIGFGSLGIVFGFIVSYMVASRVTRPVSNSPAQHAQCRG
jgi:hypothetical protein